MAAIGSAARVTANFGSTRWWKSKPSSKAASNIAVASRSKAASISPASRPCSSRWRMSARNRRAALRLHDRNCGSRVPFTIASARIVAPGVRPYSTIQSRIAATPSWTVSREANTSIEGPRSLSKRVLRGLDHQRGHGPEVVVHQRGIHLRTVRDRSPPDPIETHLGHHLDGGIQDPPRASSSRHHRTRLQRCLWSSA